MSTLGSFIWSIADQLRGPYRPNQYGNVILPLTILRRLDCILEPDRETVWELAQKGCSGIYHVAGAEKLSRLEIGQLLLARWPEIKTGIKSGSARDFACPPRALDTSLDIAKAQKVLSRPLPKFSEWLAAHPAERI